MHDIEPHFRWREMYVSERDKHSPFYGRTYSEFDYPHRLYNFYLHPQWDDFGSSTLYAKILAADYDDNFVLIELIGEWNDTLHNDIMFLKRNVIDVLLAENIVKFAFFCENLLNFHASPDDDYYAEWSEEILENQGWIVFLDVRPHVEEEMQVARLQHYAHFGDSFNEIHWRVHKPLVVFQLVDALVNNRTKHL